MAAIEEALGNAIYQRSYEVRETVEVRVTPQELLVLSYPGADRVECLIRAVRRNISRTELQEALKLRDRRHFIESYLNPALDAGLIEMTLPDKPTSGNQRYRRTTLGEKLARRLAQSGE